MAEPYVTNVPNYSAYGQAGLLAKTAYQNALARLNRGRQDTLRQYGYAGDIDPESGVLRNLRVDPNNPYGQYQGMLSSHAQQWEQAGSAALDRGLGRGGLAAQGERALRHQFGGEAAALGEGLTGAISGFQEEQQNAAYERDRALYEAELEQARNAIGGGDFNPADFSGVSTPSYDYSPSTDTVADDTSLAIDDTTITPTTGRGTTKRPMHTQLVNRRNQLVRTLLARGVTPAQYARKNPADARRYGLRPTTGSNTAAVRAARASAPRPTPRRTTKRR